MSAPARILIVIGTPLPDSLVHALAASYAEGASSRGAEIRTIDLARDPIPAHPTLRAALRAPRDETDLPLEPEVARYLDDLLWADHLVIVHPQWWGTYPAALKAFIDRVFLSGAAFRAHPEGRGWDRLLTGRTARIIMTMDSPRWWNRLRYRNAAETSLTRAVLGYCGIRTTGVTRLPEVRLSTEQTRHEWLADVRRAGVSDATAARASEPRARVTV
ncbi:MULTISPECIES: NAD(P)H-dependent oxidoreductase [Microbacterium]|uniref:NAD(P)H-dependent oxidoreductase n=1 Tax=Microbacterium TaxID=33882 RepID=UPI001D17350B|nr:NAD(P)H-dependent oxidoreductase [Microbacterium testaceum]MCC4249783.1 NAD(P)H-dependent oxidoreductase [Microbacterium testaceum]